MPNTKSSYAPDRSITTTMERQPLNRGPVPDFWADLEAMTARLAPPAIRTQPAAFARAAPAAPRFGPVSSGAPLRSQSYRDGSGAGAGMHVPGPDYTNWTPRAFGRPAMSPQGVLGTFVNPLDVPVALQGAIPTGYFTDDATSNYLYSPTVNASLYRTGQTQRERSR